MRLLQFVQQQTGLSRRKAQAAIEAGVVSVNGRRVVTPFVEVLASNVKSLEVQEKVIPFKRLKVGVYKYYKPRRMLCSYEDPHHHYAMGKVLRRPELKGYKIAGRLDRDAEGLLLLTNDGQLLNQLAHPRYGVEKVYQVLVPKVLRYRQTFDAFRQMQHGIVDQGETLRIVRGKILHRGQSHTTLAIVLNEGKNHEVKRLCRRYGWYVKRLQRVEMGGVQLGRMKPGELKPLSAEERTALDDTMRGALANMNGTDT